MEPKFILDIIGVFFEILLAYLFFRIFYNRTDAFSSLFACVVIYFMVHS